MRPADRHLNPADRSALGDSATELHRALFLKYTNRNSKIRWETKMGGTPEEKPAVYRKANVPPEVELIKTPLLILHGEKDPQVPTQESAEFAEALKKAGKTYLYFTYPNCAAKGYSRSGELEQRRVKPGKKTVDRQQR
jgi:acetyl esterase/lipase